MKLKWLKFCLLKQVHIQCNQKEKSWNECDSFVSIVCFAFASAQRRRLANNGAHNVPDVHQFEMTPKKNFCLENSFQFHLLLSNWPAWHGEWRRAEWVRDVPGRLPWKRIIQMRPDKWEKRYNRKVDGDNKYVNALSFVRCIKIYNNMFSQSHANRLDPRCRRCVWVCSLSVYRTFKDGIIY